MALKSARTAVTSNSPVTPNSDVKDEGRKMKEEDSSPATDSHESTAEDHPSSFTIHLSKRRFGQNFLIDQNVVDRIVNSVQPRADETIIEIGPGRGALTSRLLPKSERLVAIEFDRDLVPQLRAQFGSEAKLKLIEADALDVDFCEVIQPAPSARVVANLPYNVATAILQKLIEQRQCISEMT